MFDSDLEQGDERSLLDQALMEELPAGAADVPTEILLGGWKRRISQAISLIVFALLAGGFFYVFGFTFGTFTMLVVSGALLTGIASGFPDLSALDRALQISAQGVRLEKLHRDQFAPWWATNRIQAKDDLSAIRFIGANVAISINAGELEDAAKKSIVFAVRAREPYHGVRIERWPRGEISGNVRRGAGTFTRVKMTLPRCMRSAALWSSMRAQAVSKAPISIARSTTFCLRGSKLSTRAWMWA